MANLKDIKRRIGSVKSTQKITNAMKLVSAAKFARANSAVEASKPYTENFKDMVGLLLRTEGKNIKSPLVKDNKEKKSLIIGLGSDRGLCGPLNATVSKAIAGFSTDKSDEGVEFDYFAFGKKIASFLVSEDIKPIGAIEKFFDRPSFDACKLEMDKFIAMFTSGEYDRIYVVYPQFKSALEQNPTVEQLLPVEAKASSSDSESEVEDVIVEPALGEFVDGLFERLVYIHFYNVVLNTAASEHGARMTAMDAATNNSKSVIKKLTLEYNRARQAAITTELTEIVSGAQALD